ncbi:MAG: phosphate signaling complex protein PhoU [Clostridiales bacterium]|nr:phosphate signaling complex protein PhoU [Clostridiales bacterium]MCD8132275.1 phosphate signaling complex protein PhoU [Clostridiales bacterium]
MRNHFDKQLNELNGGLITMGHMIEQAIEFAIESIVHHDVEKAKSNVEYDDEIDHQMRDIEGLCMKLLMKQQPVASDLRLVSSALRMVADMERIGDNAADISEISIYLADARELPEMEVIKKMAAESMVMVVDAVQAFVNRDIRQAEEVSKQDDIMDALFVESKQTLTKLIQEKSAYTEVAADLLLVAKYFERIGDHAENISKWVIYTISGERR